MKNSKFLQFALALVVTVLCFTDAQGQWLADPSSAPVGDNDVSTNIYRKTSVAIADLNPFPNDIELFVGGRIAQRFSGSFGSTGSNDRWLAMGGNFGTPNPTQTYGLLRHWNNVFYISGVKDGKHGVTTWSGSGRHDFDYVDNSNNNITYMSILNNGSVNVGTTTAVSGIRFFVSGRTGCTLGVWSVSDKRYKKDIRGIDGALDKIRALEGKTYKFKRGEINGLSFEEAGDQDQIGFLAQDLEKVFPELVNIDQSGYYSVNYTALIPVLVEGMKEQDETIETQKEEIEELKSRIDRLESLITSIAEDKLEKKKLPSTQSTAVLKQNAPNPFNNLTTIEYELPSDVYEASLVIYDLNGKTVESFAISGNGTVEFDAANLVNGTYIYAIMAEGKNLARQTMVVQK